MSTNTIYCNSKLYVNYMCNFLLFSEPSQQEIESTASKTVEDSSFIFASLIDMPDTLSGSETLSDAELEVRRYIDFPVPTNSKLNLMEWWNMNRTLFPRLFTKFLSYAPIMPCTTSVERLFSHSGNTLTVKRNRLDPIVLEELVFLNKNKSY